MTTKTVFALLFSISIFSSFGQLKSKKLYRLITNDMDHEIAPALTADGKTIVYFAQDFSKKWFAETSQRRGSKWAKPEDLPVLNLWDKSKLNLLGSHCISPDGKTIYFSTKKYPSVGGYDIYKVTKSGTQWGTPENLAKPVCSDKADVYPFVSIDGASLVFVRADNADEKTGACGDIYLSKIKGSTWQAPVKLNLGNGCVTRAMLSADNQVMYFAQKEGAVQNLYVSRKSGSTWGTPKPFTDFNTNEDDILFGVTADASKIYYSRKVDATYDLYEAEIPKNLRGKQVYWEKGQIRNTAGKSLPGVVYIHDVNTGELIQKERVSSSDGYEFRIFEGPSYQYYFVPSVPDLMYTVAKKDMSNDPKFSYRAKKRVVEPVKTDWIQVDLSNTTQAYKLDFEYLNKFLSNNSSYKMEVVATGPQPDTIFKTVQVFDHFEVNIETKEMMVDSVMVTDTVSIDSVEITRDSLIVEVPPRINYLPKAKSKLQSLGIASTKLVGKKEEDIPSIPIEAAQLEIYYRFKK